MASYQYLARDRSGVAQRGQLDARGEEDVLNILQGRGLIVTSISRKDLGGGAHKTGTARRMHGRISTEDKVRFCQQFATLVEAGVPLVKSLEVICSQVESRPLFLALERVRRDIESGDTLRDAVAKHPNIFTAFWLNLIETGEASGHLAQSLEQLASYLEAAQQIRSKAMTAMIYPLVLIGAAVVAVAVFMLKIIPIFSGVFTSMGVQLPLLTQALIAASALSRRYALVLAAGVAVGAVALKRFVQTEQGRWLVDGFLLKLPIFNKLIIGLQLAQFARGLSTLLESGVPILHALDIMASSASNKRFGKAITQVKGNVREGKTMAEPLAETGLFPPMVVQMVQVGEEIGELGKMLDRVAKYYERQVTIFVDRMSVLFEPIAIVVMAVVVGTIVVAMYMPIFNLASTYRAN